MRDEGLNYAYWSAGVGVRRHVDAWSSALLLLHEPMLLVSESSWLASCKDDNALSWFCRNLCFSSLIRLTNCSFSLHFTGLSMLTCPHNSLLHELYLNMQMILYPIQGQINFLQVATSMGLARDGLRHWFQRVIFWICYSAMWTIIIVLQKQAGASTSHAEAKTLAFRTLYVNAEVG